MRKISFPVMACLLVGAMAAVALWAARAAPPGLMLPVHWNGAGQGDHLVPAWQALLHPVGMAAVISLLVAGLPRIEPMQNRLEGSQGLLMAVWQGLMALMIGLEAGTIGAVLGHPLPPAATLVMVGLLLMWLGNALPKSRPGFFIGIRTPWTLTDTDNWIATHRFGARSMMLAGLAVVVLPFLPVDDDRRQTLFIVAVLLGALSPMLYSLAWWRRHGVRR